MQLLNIIVKPIHYPQSRLCAKSCISEYCKKREYWTKGNILSQFGQQMSGQPMIFLFVQYSLIFNIHLYMIWHWLCYSIQKIQWKWWNALLQKLLLKVYVAEKHLTQKGGRVIWQHQLCNKNSCNFWFLIF